MRVYYVSIAIILVMASLLKLLAVDGSQALLNEPDLVFNVPNRLLLKGTALIELAVGIFLIGKADKKHKALVVAWLATSFLIYRIGIFAVSDGRGRCACLGSLTDSIPVTPDQAEMLAKLVVAYMIIGSYGILWRMHVQKRAFHARASQEGASSVPAK